MSPSTFPPLALSRPGWRFALGHVAIGLMMATARAADPGAVAAPTVPLPSSPASASPVPSAAPAARTTLRLMAFNDFHGHLQSGELSLTLPDPADATRTMRVASGGAAALAGLVQALRAQQPHSLLLSTGDLVGATPLVSALFHHEATVEVMNQLGLDIGTLGNHEFDAGTAELLRLTRGGCAPSSPGGLAGARSCALGPFQGARFGLLAANVHRVDGGGTLLAPHALREVGGAKLGLVGVVTRSTPWIVRPSAVAGLRFEDEAEAVLRSAAQLRALGAQAIVALVHEGGEIGTPGGLRADWNDESCPGARGEVFALARRIAPVVDVIFSAHTHQGYNCRVGDRPVMQAVAHGRGLSVVDLVLDGQGRVDTAATRSRNLPVFHGGSEAAARETLTRATPAPWADALRQARPVAAIAHRVDEYARLAAPVAGRTVGHIGGPFDRRGDTDSAAGRLVADAQLAATQAPAQGGAQLALTNPGGLRADLPCRGQPPCSVTQADAFALQPFGNSLVVMSLSGRELKALLEGQQDEGDTSARFLSPSASLRYRWQAQRPAGQRVADLRLNGQPVTAGQTVRLAVNSYLAEGGDGHRLLRQGRDRVGGPQDLDALLAHLARNPAPTPAPRITRVVGRPAPQAAPLRRTPPPG